MYDDMHHDVRAPKPWIRWLLLLVILALVLLVGYAIGNMQNQPDDAASSATVSTNTNTESSDAINATPTTQSGTADTDNVASDTATVELTQTFTHPYGYQVKYPTGWDHSKTDALETCFAPAADFTGGALSLFCISVERVTVEEFLSNREITALRQETIMVNDVSATKVVVESTGLESSYVFIPGNGLLYITHPGIDADTEQQIIDSFQVTDPSADLSGVN